MKAEFATIIDQFSTKKILVLGDFILDVYLKGTSTRLSPEAPVPVVDVIDRVERTGGAANTAMNIKALGADVTFMSVIGMDEEGWKATRLLQQSGINTSRLIRFPKRRTIVKSRVMAGSHVITRFDSGSEFPVDSTVEQMLIRYLRNEYMSYDAIVISDYNKGVITQKIVEALVELQMESPRFVAVDSKRLSFFKYLYPSFVKPNYEEAIALISAPRLATGRTEQVSGISKEISFATNARTIAVTLDHEGAVVFHQNEYICRTETPKITSPNVAGAGDTYVSVFTLASLSGASAEQASALSCTASSIAVKKEGTAVCNLVELRGYYAMNQKQVSSLKELAQLCAYYKNEGKRIVFTNGCFDILHSGHVSYLNRARQLGDVLIVGVNNDSSIRRLKGEKRPINPLADRMHVLEGLSAITHLVDFGHESDDTPITLIKVVKPDVFVKGGDYTREKLPEAETVEREGGEIVFLSLVPDHSTTQIIQQIYSNTTLAVA